MQKQGILLFLLIWYSNYGFSTSDSLKTQTYQPYSIALHSYYGFIIPHRSGLENLTTSHAKMLEISIDKHTNGTKQWEQFYANPNIGISFFFINMGNPTDLGYGFGVLPYINYPIYTREKVRYSIRVGFGSIYATSPFQQGKNKNTVYGSNLNALVNFIGESKIKLTPKLTINPGISFTHFSNGAWQLPNLGVNIAALNLGVNYFLHSEIEEVTPLFTPFKPYMEMSISGGIGGKEIYPVGGKRYFVSTGNIELAARISPMSQFSIGIDEFYNTSVKPSMEKQLATTLSNIDILQTGIVIGYGLKMNRLQIGVAWGTYVITKTITDKRFYHKLTNIYYVTDNIFAKFILKSHFAKADFFEFGLGYRLWKSN